MQSVISAEEFQRFQTQLLDLREAQILATEAKLNAEKRVSLLESEVSRLRTLLTESQSGSNHNSSTIHDLQKENQLLREKLLSTESAFQLQSSTLHAECHRLTAELGQLRESQLTSLSHPELIEAECQTEDELFREIGVPSQQLCTNEELDIIRLSMEETELRFDRISESVNLLQDKICSIESVMSSQIKTQHEALSKLTHENQQLQAQLEQSTEAVNQSFQTEKDLRNQLEAVKRRSEKLNRELRRQLNRFLRGQVGDQDLGQLRRNSLHSSSSSLSIQLNGAQTCNGSPIDPGSLASHGDSVRPEDTVSCRSKTSFDDLPPGFFSMADFKSLVDRMSEVQEENCTLRRHNQILQAEIMAKSQAIQHELNKQLLKTPPNQPTTTGTSFLDFGLSNLPWLTSSSKQTSKTHVPLSSVNMETVNRLKLMCEQLITQNVQLTEKLQSYEGSKSSSCSSTSTS